MLNCKEATTLISYNLERRLTLSEKVSLRLHLFICHYCRSYLQHLRFLHRILPKIDAHIEAQEEQKLPPETKAKIESEVKKQLLEGH